MRVLITTLSLSSDIGNIDRAHNTPANDSWTLSLTFSQTSNNKADITDPISQILRIVFRATGEIDYTQTTPGDLNMANTILSPVIDFMEVASAVTGIPIDPWRCINWIFVSIYWTLLADLGQLAPTTYAPLKNPTFYRDDFSTAWRHASTNNIFVNETLYKIYTDLLLETILPCLNMTVPPGGIAPLSDTNQLTLGVPTFRRSYTCSVRVWRAPLTAFVSILVAQYALIRGGYAIFFFIAGWYQKRKTSKGTNHLRSTLISANHCEGCGQEPLLQKESWPTSWSTDELATTPRYDSQSLHRSGIYVG
jgi:hypothetical protein